MCFQYAFTRKFTAIFTNTTHFYSTKYWTQEKTRFHSFMRNVHKTMPQLRLPVVILYWPLQPGLGDELKEKIPLLLNIYTTSVASDHRVVIMTPQNACEELPEAIQWLGQNGRKPSQLIKALKPEGTTMFSAANLLTKRVFCQACHLPFVHYSRYAKALGGDELEHVLCIPTTISDT